MFRWKMALRRFGDILGDKKTETARDCFRFYHIFCSDAPSDELCHDDEADVGASAGAVASVAVGTGVEGEDLVAGVHGDAEVEHRSRDAVIGQRGRVAAHDIDLAVCGQIDVKDGEHLPRHLLCGGREIDIRVRIGKGGVAVVEQLAETDAVRSIADACVNVMSVDDGVV